MAFGSLSEPENNPPVAKKKVKPTAKINRFNIGAVILIQVVLAFICVCLVNYLTAGKHIRKDLTTGGQYTLSDYSMKFLNSELLENHKDTIKIFVISKQNPLYSLRLRSVFEEYSRISAAEIEVEFIVVDDELLEFVADSRSSIFTAILAAIVFLSY